MSKGSSLRGLAAMVAGGVLLSAGGAWAQAEGGAGAVEDCSRYSMGSMMFSGDVMRAKEAAREAEYQAQKAQRLADKIRTMAPDARARTLVTVESAITYHEGRLADDGGSDPGREQTIRELKASRNALKDAELRANDLELTGGFVTSDRNALDSFARELAGKAAEAKTREQQAAQTMKDNERALADCLARQERQRASLDRERELLASAAGADDFGDGDSDEDGYGGYDDDIGSDAYPPRSSVRPPRTRPARPARWASPGAYEDPARNGGGRRARGAGGYGERAWAGGGRRARSDEGRRSRGGYGRRDDLRADGRNERDGRRERGGRRNRGGKGGKSGEGGAHCHTNPATGQQHCGVG